MHYPPETLDYPDPFQGRSQMTGIPTYIRLYNMYNGSSSSLLRYVFACQCSLLALLCRCLTDPNPKHWYLSSLPGTWLTMTESVDPWESNPATTQEKGRWYVSAVSKVDTVPTVGQSYLHAQVGWQSNNKMNLLTTIGGPSAIPWLILVSQSGIDVYNYNHRFALMVNEMVDWWSLVNPPFMFGFAFVG